MIKKTPIQIIIGILWSTLVAINLLESAKICKKYVKKKMKNEVFCRNMRVTSSCITIVFYINQNFSGNNLISKTFEMLILMDQVPYGSIYTIRYQFQKDQCNIERHDSFYIEALRSSIHG